MVTVILVRHADIDLPPPLGNPNPPLNAAGMVRAADLARVLERAGVARIFTSTALRTQQTAAPIAAKLALVPAVLNWDPPAVTRLRAGAFGDVVLIVGHSNTVPEIVQQLTGEAAPIGAAEFDNLLVVTVDGAAGRLLRLKYGA